MQVGQDLKILSNYGSSLFSQERHLPNLSVCTALLRITLLATSTFALIRYADTQERVWLQRGVIGAALGWTSYLLVKLKQVDQDHDEVPLPPPHIPPQVEERDQPPLLTPGGGERRRPTPLLRLGVGERRRSTRDRTREDPSNGVPYGVHFQFGHLHDPGRGSFSNPIQREYAGSLGRFANSHGRGGS